MSMRVSESRSKKSFGRLHSSRIWQFQLGSYVPDLSRKVLRPASGQCFATDAETSASVVIVLVSVMGG